MIEFLSHLYDIELNLGVTGKALDFLFINQLLLYVYSCTLLPLSYLVISYLYQFSKYRLFYKYLFRDKKQRPIYIENWIVFLYSVGFFMSVTVEFAEALEIREAVHWGIHTIDYDDIVLQQLVLVPAGVLCFLSWLLAYYRLYLKPSVGIRKS